MSKFKKSMALMGTALLLAQSIAGFIINPQKAEAATYSPVIQELMSRPYPRLFGNQWHVSNTGYFNAGTHSDVVNFAAKYLDIMNLNRAGGSMNDLFLDFYESTRDPSRGLLKVRNDVYQAASSNGRRVYVLAYHNMTDVWNYESVSSFPNQNFWMKPDGQNIGTWDYMDKHNYWFRNNDGSIVPYPGYSNSQRRFWDSRIPAVREYWAQHAKGVSDQGFDGIFADNWLRSGFEGPDRVGIQNGWNAMGGRYKELAPNKILIGNSPPLDLFTTRDICMLEDRIDDVEAGDKSVTGYFSYSDQGAAMGQAVVDTYWDEERGPFETFRLPMALLTDNIFGLTLNTKQGNGLDHQRVVIEKLGKVGYPTGPRYLANGVWQRDYTAGKAIVNGTSTSKTISLPTGVYKDIYGNSVNTVTLSPFRGIVLKTTSISPPPPSNTVNAPSNVAVTGVSKGADTGNYYVNLSWKDNSTNETGFQILQSINSTNNYQVIKTPAQDLTTYSINLGSTPTNGTYYYKLIAFNANATSVDSNVATTQISTETTPPPPTPTPTNGPTAPSNVTVTGVSKGATTGNYYVNLTWKDNSTDETGFQILQSINSTSNYQVIKTPARNGTSYGINLGSTPTNGTYYYKVLAVNANGPSADSNIATTQIGSVTPPPAPVPSAASEVSASIAKGASTGNYYATINWKDNSSNETGFEIYQSVNSTNNFQLIKTADSGATTYSANLGVSPAIGTYYFKVVAINANGKSAESNIANTQLSIPVPIAPSGLSASVAKDITGRNAVIFNWQDLSNNEDGFNLYLSTSPTGTFSKIAGLSANQSIVIQLLDAVSAQTSLYYMIKAFNSGGESSSSNTSSVIINP